MSKILDKCKRSEALFLLLLLQFLLTRILE